MMPMDAHWRLNGYGKGVPMGGALRGAKSGSDAPGFLVAALKGSP